MASDITTLLKTIQDGITELATQSFKEYVKDIGNDSEIIYQAFKGDIERWSIEVENGDLSLEDLEFLIKGKKDLIKITVLTQKGAAKIQLDKFKQGVIDLIFSSIKSVIK